MSETIEPKKKKPAPAKVGAVLTEAEFQTLDKMIRSTDKQDHTMAQLALNQCDVQKSIYWIWELARHGKASNMVYLRTKASREFVKECELFRISWMNATDFGLWPKRKGWLTEEIYQRLKPEIVKQLKDRNEKGNFYEVHIVIKEKYREYDPQSTLTHLPTTKWSI